MLKILCVGAQWRGSNAGGLFKAISRQGNIIEIIDEFYEIPLRSRSLTTKLISWLFRSPFIAEFNDKIQKKFFWFKPDVVLVYKGTFILPGTLEKLKNHKAFLVNFYPDVSFHTHGKYLRNSLGFYHLIFTTKSFGISDLKNQLNIDSTYYIPHGYDPEIHQPAQTTTDNQSQYSCDVSFIGTWSPKKEKILTHIKENIPGINLKVWGQQWEKSKQAILKPSIQFRGITGTEYALGIKYSKINLGLLSEKVTGASNGDEITSRTFHIPAVGGFLLHECTEELAKYFNIGVEVECFKSLKDLSDKINYYLVHDLKRETISLKGHERALNEHSLDKRASEIITVLNDRLGR